MFNLGLAIFFDLVTVPLCCIALLRWGRLGHSHPATIYLFFHITSFSVRGLAIFGGAATVFSTWGSQFSPVQPDEIGRALFLADLALVSMTVAWLRVAKVAAQHVANKGDQTKRVIPLSLKHIRLVSVLSLPIGILGLLILGRIPGTSGALQYASTVSGYLQITKTWVGLSLLALIYWYGLRWELTVPLGAYILFMSVQGGQRNLAILPAVLLLQIYLDRRGLRLPPVRILVLLGAMFLLFYPMKDIGNGIQSGQDPATIISGAQQSIGDVFAGQSPDQQFLDEYASTLTLVDERGVYYYGQPYLSLVTLPIPRQWWPDKPGLADFEADFSVPWRPMAATGMIVTFLGEAYANFGYVGIIVVPFLLAYLLGRIYFRAYSESYFTLIRFLYLLIAVNLIQVYRDGLESLFVFTLVNMMPLAIIAILHFVLPSEESGETVHAIKTPTRAESRVQWPIR